MKTDGRESEHFHLSFQVADLIRSKAFYADVVGCPVTRDRGSWFDCDFFGHQVTLHQRPADASPRTGGMDHFGVVLGKADWDRLRARLDAAGAVYRVAPSASGKFVIDDPDGYGLEFKYRSGTG